MESCLAKMAGAELTNFDLNREKRSGITIGPQAFQRMAPQIILVADTLAWLPLDVIDWCRKNNLSAPALRDGKVFGLHPFRSATNPDWILDCAVRHCTMIYCIVILNDQVFVNVPKFGVGKNF